MKQKFRSPIDELKYLLTLQLKAHLANNEQGYNKLEEQIGRVEKKL